MYIAWKRILLAAGVIASAGLATPALAKHSDHSIRDGRETQVRHHARHAAGRHAHAGRRFVRFEHRRFASARRPHRIASGESAGSRGNSPLVAEARRYLGGNPTGWGHN